MFKRRGTHSSQSKLDRLITTESPTMIKNKMESKSRAGTNLIKKHSNEKIYHQSSQNSASKISIT